MVGLTTAALKVWSNSQVEDSPMNLYTLSDGVTLIYWEFKGVILAYKILTVT